jgi:hypothetical protein
MIAALVLAAHAVDVRVPVPVRRLFDRPDRVCLDTRLLAGVEPVVIDDGIFEATCDSAQLCLQLLTDAWPARVAPLSCGTDPEVTLVPVPAFDPEDRVWDGVSIRRDVDAVAAAFRVAEVERAAGILHGGRCGIDAHLLWVEAPQEPRRQRCTLVLEDGTERVVPIHLVRRLP